jgi:hypothetical protein
MPTTQEKMADTSFRISGPLTLLKSDEASVTTAKGLPISFEIPYEIEEVIALFEEVAEAEGWQHGGELRAHVPRSTYFALREDGYTTSPASERDGRVVGGLQLVRADADGKISSHQVWPELSLKDVSRSAHIAVLAVARPWRGKSGGLFWLLTAAMWNFCVRSGIRDLYLEATPRTMHCYERFGWPLEAVGPLRRHWGEECFPCHLSVRDVAGTLAERAVSSEAYRCILSKMVGGISAGGWREG